MQPMRISRIGAEEKVATNGKAATATNGHSTNGNGKARKTKPAATTETVEAEMLVEVGGQ
jgi:hypothetical protein